MNATPSHTQRIGPVIFLASVLVLGAVPRFYGLTQSNLWHDEAYSALLAPQSFSDIATRTARDVHPPLYYWILHGWISIWGSGEGALRSLSVLLGLGSIAVSYALSRRLFDENTARLGAVFVALGPFLVRYNQEARMYSLVGFFLLLSTLLLLSALEHGGWKRWSGYALCIAAALYTHYFAVFAIFAHWLYVVFFAHKVTERAWWLSNISAAILFLPWLPSAYVHFTRVQEKFWIAPVGLTTLPNPVFQQLFYADGDLFTVPGMIVLALAGLAWLLVVAREDREHRDAWALLTLYTLCGPILVFLLSFKRPIYTERCFVYASPGFYLLLAALCCHTRLLREKLSLRIASLSIVILFFCVGILNVNLQARHRVKEAAEHVQAEYKPGDVLLAGELFSYVDFAYYNRTGTRLKLWAPNGISGIEETSLFYERADEVGVREWSQIQPATGVVWLIGKSGKQPYFDGVPNTWKEEGEAFVAGVCTVRKYRVVTAPALATPP